MDAEPMASPDEPAPSFTQVAPYYDELMKEVPYRTWTSYVLAVARRHGCEPARILELACGTATMALRLAAEGYELVGLDGSAEMLAVAQRKAKEAAVRLPLILADLRSFEAPGPFELAICLYDSLNNILEPEGLQRAFQCTCRALRPGGLFIFDLNTEYALRANLFTQQNLADDALLQYRWESSYDYGTRISTIDMHFWVLEGGTRRYFREIHRQRAYSITELGRLLDESGLSLVAAYDGVSLRAPQRRTDRLYVVARRKTGAEAHTGETQEIVEEDGWS